MNNANEDTIIRLKVANDQLEVQSVEAECVWDSLIRIEIEFPPDISPDAYTVMDKGNDQKKSIVIIEQPPTQNNKRILYIRPKEEFIEIVLKRLLMNEQSKSLECTIKLNGFPFSQKIPRTLIIEHFKSYTNQSWSTLEGFSDNGAMDCNIRREFNQYLDISPRPHFAQFWFITGPVASGKYTAISDWLHRTYNTDKSVAFSIRYDSKYTTDEQFLEAFDTKVFEILEVTRPQGEKWHQELYKTRYNDGDAIQKQILLHVNLSSRDKISSIFDSISERIYQLTTHTELYTICIITHWNTRKIFEMATYLQNHRRIGNASKKFFSRIEFLSIKNIETIVTIIFNLDLNSSKLLANRIHRLTGGQWLLFKPVFKYLWDAWAKQEEEFKKRDGSLNPEGIGNILMGLDKNLVEASYNQIKERLHIQGEDTQTEEEKQSTGLYDENGKRNNSFMYDHFNIGHTKG